MGDIVKLALRLFVFALVAAVALALTNEVTKGPIEAQKLAAKMDALNTVLPGCEYTQIEYEGLAEGSVLDEIFEGKDASGATVGYALTAAPQGYGGPIPITVGISTEGYITQTYVGALQETAGLGSRVGEDEFKSQFIAIAADPDTLRDDVDTIGGATVSSGAFVNAVSEILTYSKNTLGIAPNAGDKDAILAAAAAAAGNAEPIVTTNTYDVTGFAPMKVEIAVDDAGKIVSVKVLEHNETPGFGADLIADTAVFDALVGQDIAGAAIDVKAGVTLTSKAINSALKAAGPQVPADPYTVKGFDKFTMEIAVSDGKIASISVPAHNETPGLGADILTEEALASLVGQDLATAKVDVKTGVTLTSKAINDALRQAAAANGIVVEAEETVAETEPTASVPAEAAGNVYEVTGFQPMKVAIDVDESGKIVSVNVLEHNETPGFGADLIGAGFDALVGQDIATAQIDVKSGVTLTSNAINEALKAAAAAAPAAEAAPAEETAAAVYEVTGFQPMKVAIDVDDAGKIVSVNVLEHNETPGFGADLIGAGFDALVGQDIATAQIDVKSGVTLTSNAINEALKAAAAPAAGAVEAIEVIEAAPAAEIAKTYEIHVKGMAKKTFTLNISVDADGVIVAAVCPENSEDKGYIALTDEALSALVGQKVTEAKYDTVTGVTVTCNAVNSALDAIAAHVRNEEVQ
ncbi:MAG: FMN-binding protein [Clostridia bacterium]|nr:FMN-binding protein [Clostridia bacterium]